MLTTRRTAAVAALALLLAVPAQSAAADGPGGGVQCPPKELDCEITAEDPGKPAGKPGKPTPGKPPGRPGKPPGRPGKPRCAIEGRTVPCSTAELGSAADQPDGRYKGTATATWAMEWTATGGAGTGETTLTRQTALSVRVGEVQVLN